jgi:hypothetical protein
VAVDPHERLPYRGVLSNVLIFDLRYE